MRDDRSLINYGIDQRRMALLIALANLPEPAWTHLVAWGFSTARTLATEGGLRPDAKAALREVAAAAAVYLQEQG